MKRKNLLKSISLLTMGIVLGFSTMSVFAYTYVNGTYSYYGPVLTYLYENRATITDWGDGLGINSGAAVSTQDGEDTPEGYMGVQAWLYKDDVLIYSSPWSYNATPDHLETAWTDVSYDNGTYYGDGQSKAYNGNGYNTYSMNSTPILQYTN